MNTRDGDPHGARGAPHWLRVLVVRNPIVVATGIALAVSAIAVGLVVKEQSHGRARDSALAEQRKDTAKDLEADRIRADDRLRKATKQNCGRIHLLEITLEDIVVSSRSQLRGYLHDGTITREQYRRALADSRRARRKLIGADCPPRTLGGG